MRNYCARSSSIPRSLRHVSPNSALEDAAHLANFLRNVVGDMFAQDGGLPSDESNMGLALCFDLLLDKIAIAGRVWVVEEVDHKKREVYCTLVKGNIPAYFGDVAGDIHTHILERMYAVLNEEKKYPYLMRHAVCRLQEARDTFRKSGMPDHPLVHLGGNMWALFPWLGSYSFLALERFLKIRCAERLGLKGLQAARPYYLQFTMKVTEEDFYRITAEEAAAEFDPLELLYPKEVPVFEKYDEYVPPELVRKGFALGVLDVEGMKRRVTGWLGSGEGRLS